MTVTGDGSPAARMRAAAAAFLGSLDEGGRAAAGRPFADDRRRWLEYRPRPRPGVSLADLGVTARKNAHRLLATALSPGAYAQAMAVLALEEVLDRREGWARGRHSEDFRVVLFGGPGDDAFGWRFEGHHLSVTMTLAGDRVSPAPLFLGANPARVDHAGHPVLRPLAPEEDLGRAVLLAMAPQDRRRAVVADAAPDDIRSGIAARAAATIEPAGVPVADLGVGARSLVEQLVALYLARLPEELADAEDRRLDRRALHFAWEGPPGPGVRHYYRLQAPDLLVEYDNTTDDGNHAHTVLRRPLSDFGDDVLAAHLGDGHAA
ncbi:DUF3500 domain-containing protein [Spirilliplanes yamanashiensis]|uniref:DUF3500 domain-containing protein n=1 Tax=Spirilliplanes yamanashiensis TaxID=42233 RepID=A0A8J3YAT4_9ACTN|nr:DUF3500 domain-containing protein [Spirilliplanes yamanashiensis]MDP9817770.1 hypothetical protein [Spirilliplanes yamanashiensis]GIJ04580.1 hypothetical protein Sya03_39320 [Spirilliplanes yamanashiensis]